MSKGPYTIRRLARSTNWSDTTLASGQIVYDKTKKTVRVGDGVTLSGRALAFDNRQEIITPNQISADVNNYSPPGLLNAGCIILNSASDVNLTGLDTTVFSDGLEDRIIFIAVDDSSDGNITLKHNNSGSTAANRFDLGRDLILTPGTILTLRYREDLSRWHFLEEFAGAISYTPTSTLRKNNVQEALAEVSMRNIQVKAMNTNDPAVTPAVGDSYVVGGSPTGAWVGHTKDIAICSDATTPSWVFLTPTNDITLVYSRTDGAFYRYTSSMWTALGSGLNDGSVLAIKLDTSTSAKRKDFRSAIEAASAEVLGSVNMFTNGSFEGDLDGSAPSIALNATGTLQSVTLLDRVSAQVRGSFVAAAQQVTSPFVGGRYALKFTVSLAQASLGANDELSCVLEIPGIQSAKLALGTANAQPQSLGFWFQAHRTGAYSGSIRNGTKARSYPFSFTVNVADTPQWIPLSNIPGDVSGSWATDASAGVLITICLAAGTSRVGTTSTWAGADYSGVTSTTNGVAATTDVFYIGNAISVAGEYVPSAARAPFVARPRNEHIRTEPQRLSAAQKSQTLINLGLAGVPNAVGDGTTDDSAALLANFAALTSGMTWDGAGKNYANSCTGIDLPAHVTIRNARFTMTGSGSNPMFYVKGSRTSLSYSGGAIAAGATSVTISGLSSDDVGKVLHITSSDTIGISGFTRGEFAFIRSVSGSTITLEEGLALSYTTSPAIELIVLKPGVKFEKVTFECNLGGSNLRAGVMFEACSHAECEIYGRDVGYYTVARILCYNHHLKGGGSNQVFQSDNGLDYFAVDGGGKLLSIEARGRGYRHVYACGWEHSTQFDTRVKVIAHAGKDAGCDAHPNVLDFQVEVLASGMRNGGTFSNQPSGLMYQGGGILRASVDVNGFNASAAVIQLSQNTSDQIYISVQGKSPTSSALRGLDVQIQKSGGNVTVLNAEYNGESMPHASSVGLSCDTNGSAAGLNVAHVLLKGVTPGKANGKALVCRTGHTMTSVAITGTSFDQTSGNYGAIANSVDSGGIALFNATGNIIKGVSGSFGIRAVNCGRSLAVGNLISGVGGATITNAALIGFTTQSANDYT